MRSKSIRAACCLLAAFAVGACAPDTPALQSFASAGPDDATVPAAEPPMAAAQPGPTVVWQLSAFALLARGYYDGILPVAEVQRHGNLGLGAGDQLNGEMALVDGRFYQFLDHGRAVVAQPTMRMPFAAVTPWNGGREIRLRETLDYAAVRARVDSALPTTNAFYALRLEGVWDVVVARTYKRETKPYPPLSRARADTVTLHGVHGTMVGFRQPSYADSLGVPNYHLHFINAGRTVGGHVLNFTTRDVRMQYSVRPDFTLRMPPVPASRAAAAP